MLEVRSWDNQQDPLLFYLSTIFPPEITWLSDFLPDVLDLIRHRVMQNVQIYLYRPLTGVRRWACAWLIWTSGRSRVILSVFTITINEWLTVFAACTTCLWLLHTSVSSPSLPLSLSQQTHKRKVETILIVFCYQFSISGKESKGQLCVRPAGKLLSKHVHANARTHTHTLFQLISNSYHFHGWNLFFFVVVLFLRVLWLSRLSVGWMFRSELSQPDNGISARLHWHRVLLLERARSRSYKWEPQNSSSLFEWQSMLG